jgi:uncharacterized membrane protein
LTLAMSAPYIWTPVIAGHALAAAAAVVLGAVILLRRKGTISHRASGWVWVTLMGTVAISSFWIFQQHYSWIHGLSVFTLVMLVLGVYRARTHRVQAHRFTMLGLFCGALLIAGLFTLAPNRLLGRALSGALGWT